VGTEPSDQQEGKTEEDQDGQRPRADSPPDQGLERNARYSVHIHTAGKTDPERVPGTFQRFVQKGCIEQVHLRGHRSGKGTNADMDGGL